MRAYSAYIERLRTLVGNTLKCDGTNRKRILYALDGEPAAELRRLIRPDIQRASGAYFSGEQLSGRTAALLAPRFSSKLAIVDPACGAGDLLIACSKYLPLCKNLKTTLLVWGRHLIGYDLHEEFTLAAKLRLALAALRRGAERSPITQEDLDAAFPHIRATDTLRSNIKLKATHLILNPPYTQQPSPSGCLWAEGNVSSAAVFLDRCLSRSLQGTQVVAILPDVLRTGSRYERWRSYIQDISTICRISVVGRFDQWADIDVFLIKLIAGESTLRRRRTWWREPSTRSVKIKDFFNIHVGAVVPHRDQNKGPWRPYLSSKVSPPWRKIEVHKDKRRYGGRTFNAPFVAIRRTSSPSERMRAVSTIISKGQNIAVENHLLVALPKKPSLAICKRLLKLLKSDHSNHWLNNRMRCRHLTVSAILGLPWLDSRQ